MKVTQTPSFMTVTYKKRKLTTRCFLKKTEYHQKELPLYMRIIYGSLKAEISMKVLLSPDEWDSDTNELKHKKKHPEIYQQQITMESDLIRIMRHRELKGLPISAKIMKQILLGKMSVDAHIGANHLLLQYLDEHIKRITENTQEYTEGTVQHYRALRGHLKNFLKSIHVEDIPIHAVDTRFLQRFDDFLMAWKNPRRGKPMNRATANRIHSKHSVVLTRAVMELLTPRNPYEGFTRKKVKSQADFLIDHEIKLLIAKRLDNQSLEIVRLYLVMAIFMGGVRFSDLKNIRSYNIIEQDSFYFLHIHRQEKTDASVMTPLLPCAVDIFKKYQWCQEETGYILPRLSQQKLNEYLKTLADLCGIQKRMTHKIARHTFATTICSQNGVPRHLTAAWLGHYTQTRTTDVYAHITKEESLIWVKKLWELYNKPEYKLNNN